MKKIKSFEQYFESSDIDKKSDNDDIEEEETESTGRIPSKYSKEELLKKGFVPKKGGGYEKK